MGTHFEGCTTEMTSGAAESVSGEPVSVAHAHCLPAASDGNNPDTEMAWAMKAKQAPEDSYKLISSVDPHFLKLTKADDQIFSEFQGNLRNPVLMCWAQKSLNQNQLKRSGGHSAWSLIGSWKTWVTVFRYNRIGLGATLRKTPSLPPWVQFFAIEVAQNWEAIAKPFTPVFMIKKRKKATVAKRKGWDSGWEGKETQRKK